MDADVLERAETLAPAILGTLDAIHLASALRVAEAGILDTVITYDARLGEDSAHHGLSVVSPT
jgi:uncharacterized protein